MVAVLSGASSPHDAESEEAGAEQRERGRLGDLYLRDANHAFRHYLERFYGSEPVEGASNVGRSPNGKVRRTKRSGTDERGNSGETARVDPVKARMRIRLAQQLED